MLLGEINESGCIVSEMQKNKRKPGSKEEIIRNSAYRLWKENGTDVWNWKIVKNTRGRKDFK